MNKKYSGTMRTPCLRIMNTYILVLPIATALILTPEFQAPNNPHTSITHAVDTNSRNKQHGIVQNSWNCEHTTGHGEQCSGFRDGRL